MKTWRHGMLAALTFAVFGVLGCMPSGAAAAGAAEALITEVPVQIVLTGTQPEEAEDFAVVLQAENASNPMPQGSADGVCTLTVSGEASASFPVIRFSRVGVYNYIIRQTAGADADCTYDDAVYHLTVYVTNQEAGGIGATSVLTPNITFPEEQTSVLNRSALSPSTT